MAKNRVLVVGATGAQGGAVARHLLKTGKFVVRGLTRSPDSPKAQAIKAAGAEIAVGDLADPASLTPALADVWGVFGVTNFWEHFDRERDHGRNLIAAVAAAKTPFFLFSSLPWPHKQTGGKLPVPHFDIKAELEQEIRDRKLPGAFVHAAFYYENFIYFLPPRKQADGSFAFGFPQGQTPLAGVATDDIGGVVAAVFQQPEAFTGKVVGLVAQDLTGDQYAAALSEATGRRVVYNHIPRETFAALGFPGADDLANMFEYNRLYIPNRQADIDQCLRLYPQMQKFREWARRHKQALIEAMEK